MTEPVSLLPATDDVPVIESEPDEELKAFKIAYRRQGDRVEEEFHARVFPPFSFFRRLQDLERASANGVPLEINKAVRRLFEVALPEEDATRLLRLIEGDEDEVGRITSHAIGGVVDLLRAMHYKLPTPPGSSSGPTRAGRTSSAARRAKGSTSTPSRRSKG